MFDSFSWHSHDEYHINFKNFKAKLSSDMRVLLWNSYSRERHKLMSLNLDPVEEYLSQSYSTTGCPALHQAQVPRSLILCALLFNRTDARLCLTVWVREVLPPINNGLIPLEKLTVSGDGTAIKAHSNPFGRTPRYLKSLPEGICTDNLRRYSDPDASWGWDSHEKRWYFGRTLYMLVCRNPELSLEVPLLLNFTSAKRHDSIILFVFFSDCT